MDLRRRGVLAFLLAGAIGAPAHAQSAAVSLAPGGLKQIAKVDPRFQSYNVEMAEVIGGRFWAPYPKDGATAAPKSFAAMFQKRQPLDLETNHRLQALARALGPAYIRVGGGWANGVWFQDDDAPQRPQAPAGFQGVLTRAQWKGVVDFARDADAELVTSFAIGAGARDAQGVWNPAQARKIIDYTHAVGGKIYAAEVANEPNVGAMGGMPKGYDGAMFARDAAVFTRFIHEESPGTKTVGPVSTGEAGVQLFPKNAGAVPTESLLAAEPRTRFDIYAYHFYGAASQRCAAMGKDIGISPDQALSEAWLARADQVFDYYKALHDRFQPGTPIWITEEGEAGCGGDRWAASFLDTFRYVDALGRMARHNVAAVFHNTLAASDYALIEEGTWRPRPSYWAALLWARLMGPTVLDAGPIKPGLHVYAQCLRGRAGGVALVAINLDRTRSASLELPLPARRYTLAADDLMGGEVKLNGRPLALPADDRMPPLEGAATAKGPLHLPPTTITYLAVPDARNPACM